MGKKENQKKVSKAHEISLAKGQRFVLAALNEKTSYAVLQESKKRTHFHNHYLTEKKSPDLNKQLYNKNIEQVKQKNSKLRFIRL